MITLKKLQEAMLFAQNQEGFKEFNPPLEEQLAQPNLTRLTYLKDVSSGFGKAFQRVSTKISTNTVKKITSGFVVQTFVDGIFIEQEFIAGDEVDVEDEDGNPVYSHLPYHPFDMVQPN